MQSAGFGSVQMGSRGPTVSQVQTKLNTELRLMPPLVPDGVFGSKTAQAVKLYQQRRGLVPDGVVGPKTAASLGVSLGGGGGRPPAPAGPPSGHAPPVTPPPGGPPPPSGGPPAGFVDLSIFNVVIEAIIGGMQKIAGSLLSWIDSDYVPQFVYDRVASMLNGAINTSASTLRGITRQAVPLGQDPAAFVTGQIRQVLARFASALSNALQPLVGLPVIGGSAVGWQRIISGLMSVADGALSNLRANGQSAQATATRIAAALESIARQIG